METARDFNVYNKISRGEHVCNGSKLFTRDEMRKMLDESGLSLDEIRVLYKLNAEAAWDEVERMATKEFLAIQPEEQIRYSNGGWLMRTLTLFEKKYGVYSLLFAFQIFVTIVSGIIVGGTHPNSIWVFMPFVLVVVTHVLAAAAGKLIDAKCYERAKENAEKLENSAREKMKLALDIRHQMMNSVCNTLRMYECMEDAMRGEFEELEEETLYSSHVTDDDLK